MCRRGVGKNRERLPVAIDRPAGLPQIQPRVAEVRENKRISRTQLQRATVRLNRLAGTTEGTQDVAQPNVPANQRRIQRDSLFQLAKRLGVATGVDQRLAKRQPCRGIIGAKVDATPKTGQRLDSPAVGQVLFSLAELLIE